MEEKLDACPFCDAPGVTIECGRVARTDWQRVYCPRCREYLISRRAIMNLPAEEREDPLIRKRIARYMYDREGCEELCIRARPPAKGQAEDRPGLDLESAKLLYREKTSPTEVYDGTLLNLKRKTGAFGEMFNSIEHRYLVPTLNDDEADAIIDALFADGFVSGFRSKDSSDYGLTLEGFRRAEELEKRKQSLPLPTPDPVGTRPTVFLSHSHKDNEFVERLACDLERQGVKVWFDGWDLDIGHDLTVKIQEGIQGSEFLAVVLSPAAVESAWVEKEWTTGFRRELEQRKVVVLPILYQDCDIPEFLKGKVYADFRRAESYDAALGNLIRCLRGESKRPPRSSTEAPIQQEYAHTIRVSFQGQNQIRKGNALSIAKWYGPEGPGGNGKLRVEIMADLTDDASYRSDLVGSTMTITPVEVPISGRVSGTIERSRNETTFDFEMSEEEFQKYYPHRQVRKSL